MSFLSDLFGRITKAKKPEVLVHGTKTSPTPDVLMPEMKMPHPPRDLGLEETVDVIRSKVRRYFFNKAIGLAEEGETLVFHCVENIGNGDLDVAKCLYVYVFRAVQEGRVDICLGFITQGNTLATPKPWSGLTAEEIRRNGYLVTILRIDKPFNANLTAEEIVLKASQNDFFDLMKETRGMMVED